MEETLKLTVPRSQPWNVFESYASSNDLTRPT